MLEDNTEWVQEARKGRSSTRCTPSPQDFFRLDEIIRWRSVAKKTLCKQMKFPRAPDLAANLETPPPDHQLPSRLFNHFLAHQHYSGSSTTPPALRLLPPPPLINCLSLARQLPAQLLNRIIGSFPQLVPRHYSSVGTISLSGVVKGSSLDLL